jgi:hypothetical protein
MMLLTCLAADYVEARTRRTPTTTTTTTTTRTVMNVLNDEYIGKANAKDKAVRVILVLQGRLIQGVRACAVGRFPLLNLDWQYLQP